MKPEIKTAIGQVTRHIFDNEKFLVGVLAQRCRKLAQSKPNDACLVGMSGFLTKRANTETFITRAELTSAYRTLWSRNSQFAEAFGDELGLDQISEPVKKISRDPNEGLSILADLEVDDRLKEGLEAVLEKRASVPYSQSLARKASETCWAVLNRHLAPKRVDVVAGDASVLICRAEYETPKGSVAVLVPVQISSDKALIPNLLVSQAGVVELNRENLEKHLISTAGRRFTVNATQVLEAVKSITEPKRKISDLDIVLARHAASKGRIEYQNSVYAEIDTQNPNVEVPRSPEADTFAEKLSGHVGAAEMMFGKSAVDQAREMIVLAFRNLDHNPSVKVADVDDSNLYFAVSFDGIGCKVPVRMQDRRPTTPGLVLASGQMFPLSAEGIDRMLIQGSSDNRMRAVASPCYGLKPEELIETVRIASQEGNVAKAEDALSVLETMNPTHFRTAFELFVGGLNGTVKTASVGCRHQRKVKDQRHLICTATGLPVHKVYQDQHGDCLPLYRKQIAEPSSAHSITNKIFWT